MYAVWIHDHEHIYDAEVSRISDISVRPAFVRGEVLLLGGAVDRASSKLLGNLKLFGAFPEPYLCDFLFKFNGRRKLHQWDFGIEAGLGRRLLRASLPIGDVQSESQIGDAVKPTRETFCTENREINGITTYVGPYEEVAFG